ncbi:MAG: TerB family tellurite resistance protein [Phycisphaerales bacterium]|jgi:tellurite resistance protein
MGKLLIPVLIVLATSVAVIFSGLINRSRLADLVSHVTLRGLSYCSKLAELVNLVKLKDLIGQFRFPDSFSDIRSWTSRDVEPDRGQESPAQPDMSVLNCRVRLTEAKEGNCVLDTFGVEICGSIHAPNNTRHTALKISILDVTDGVPNARPVQARSRQWSSPDGSNTSVFCYEAELGRLPHQVTALSDWTAVAQLQLDWLVLPRKGRRDLQFNTSVLSADSGQELACAQCTFTYDNPVFGYMDLQENIERTKVLAVALAFAVSAADDKLYDCEVELIKNWARDNILDNSEQEPDGASHKLDKALGKTVAFFRDGNKLNSYEICREIVEIAPVAQRYDILDLCLYVAQANGSVAAEELTILRDLASWLEVDADKFRVMMEKVLPIDMHEVTDVEAVLGINSEMSKEKARQHLNKEYSKWNSRVTNSDPEIQSQADQMLKLIMEARGQYTAEQPVPKEGEKVATS